MRDLTVVRVHFIPRFRSAMLCERAARLGAVSHALADAGQFYDSLTYRKAALEAVRESFALNEDNGNSELS